MVQLRVVLLPPGVPRNGPAVHPDGRPHRQTRLPLSSRRPTPSRPARPRPPIAAAVGVDVLEVEDLVQRVVTEVTLLAVRRGRRDLHGSRWTAASRLRRERLRAGHPHTARWTRLTLVTWQTGHAHIVSGLAALVGGGAADDGRRQDGAVQAVTIVVLEARLAYVSVRRMDPRHQESRLSLATSNVHVVLDGSSIKKQWPHSQSVRSHFGFHENCAL